MPKFTTHIKQLPTSAPSGLPPTLETNSSPLHLMFIPALKQSTMPLSKGYWSVSRAAHPLGLSTKTKEALNFISCNQDNSMEIPTQQRLSLIHI